MLLLAVVSCSVLPARSAAAENRTLRVRLEAAPAMADLIADLDSDQYAVRKKATRALIEAGAPAVSPLTAAAADGTLEVQIRVVRVLQELYTASESDETIDAAEVALEALADSSNRGLAARADRVLNENYERRERRALTQIKRLGGVINYSEAPNLIAGNFDPNLPPISYILLGGKWKGGDEGLKYVKRVTRLRVLYVAGAAGARPISGKAQEDLEASLPDLIVQNRGRAYLGIGGGPHPNGCQVIQVKAETAAAKAGLREFDVIQGFGGKKIDDFDTLIELIKTYAPGDKVKLDVIRGSRSMTLEVVMGEWK